MSQDVFALSSRSVALHPGPPAFHHDLQDQKPSNETKNPTLRGFDRSLSVAEVQSHRIWRETER